MGNMKLFVVVCAVFFNLLSVNKSDGQESASPNILNIVVILDTSDRVSREKHPDQKERDIRIVKEIVNQFEQVVKDHINNATDLEYKDSLAVVVPDQPTVPPIPWEIMYILTIEDPGEEFNSIADTFADLEAQRKALVDGLDKLYNHVKQNEQTGSDIWSWFKYEAEDYLSEDRRNLIICLSDGYLNFDRNIEARRFPGTFMRVRELRNDPNWKQRIHNGEGLFPIGTDFSPYNVKFLMGEIKPQSEKDSGIPYQQDFDIIKEYWKTWLNAMGIQDTNLRGPLSLKTIKSFISDKDSP